MLTTATMKKFFFTIITLCFGLVALSQGWRSNEMEIKVPFHSVEAASQLYNLNLNGDIYKNYAILYVVPKELESLIKAGFRYEVQIENLNEHFKNFWQTDEAYHSYQQIIDLADSLATHFPAICKKVIFGTSLGGRQLAALKISDNVETDENEAEVFFDGGIHGDEIGGAENLIRFARDLCLGYGTITQITNLINGRETWLYLMVNPDGREGMTRYNNNGEDLNRDCGYMWDTESLGAWSQHETKVLRNAVLAHQFVVYTSYHSGTEFISHPWSYRAAFSPDHAHVNQLAGVYASTSGYSNIPYGPGYTGMYAINGSTKDASYGIQGSVSWSMEISMDKQPPASQIMLYYNYNKPAMLAMIEYAGYGLAGTVTDASNGQPVAATVFVNSFLPSYTDPLVGDYHKYVLPGTYSITVEANGYQTKTISNVVVTANNASVTDIQLTPEDNHGIYKIVACQIPGNNFNDEGATWASLGQPDNVNYSVGKSGWIIMDMQEIVFNGAGPDMMVFEGDASAEGYTLFAGTSMDGPWFSMGTGMGTSEFSFENCTIGEARYFKLLDDGDGSATVADAGFDLDAIQVLSAVTGPYIIMDSYDIDDSNGNNNGILEPGETADYIITLKNVGSENALAITGTLACNDQYVTVITTSPQTFGNIAINTSATATFTVSAAAGAPAGHTATLVLTYLGTNVAASTKNISVIFPDYCQASTTTEDEYISKVVCGEIDNSSGWQGGVANYTNLSVNIDAGTSMPIIITNGTPWASDIVIVWVDWNNDFELGNPANEVFTLTNVGGSGASFTGNIAAPAGTASGNYRMRVRMTYSTAPTPCGSASYGEIEDYTVVVGGNTLTAIFTSDVTELCAGGQVHFYDNSTGNITSWAWEFPQGTPSTSTLQNPVVTYNSPGMPGVSLTVSDGTSSNTFNALEYLTVLGEVNTPNQPTGDTEICQDAPNGTYNTSGNPTYVTSWIWDLSPTTAGTITPNGPIAVVNWSATFAGTASLKVKTSNLCGESAWSDAIGITIVPLPAAAGNVTGDEIVCQEQVQLYTVPVIADATNYEWSLEPSAAGIMNITTNENTVTWSDSWMGSAILKVRGVNDCGTGTWSADFEVLVQNCTGISTPDQNDVFTIFPNPGNGDFTVNATKNFDKEITISVVNMIGVEVFSKSFKSLSSGKSFGVNLVGLPGGIYYLKIETETGNFIQKILIHQ
jgi:PKD repeat protein